MDHIFQNEPKNSLTVLTVRKLGHPQFKPRNASRNWSKCSTFVNRGPCCSLASLMVANVLNSKEQRWQTLRDAIFSHYLFEPNWGIRIPQRSARTFSNQCCLFGPAELLSGLFWNILENFGCCLDKIGGAPKPTIGWLVGTGHSVTTILFSLHSWDLEKANKL